VGPILFFTTSWLTPSPRSLKIEGVRQPAPRSCRMKLASQAAYLLIAFGIGTPQKAKGKRKKAKGKTEVVLILPFAFCLLPFAFYLLPFALSSPFTFCLLPFALKR
jgi:hypothetical protein